MKNLGKYAPVYFKAPFSEMNWAKKEYVDKAPIWCSVDLRDGNQALIIPMSLDEKIEFFNMLVSLGFKEIEIGFPAASDTEYKFCRRLIEDNLIPDDVSIQVLTQAREHIIEKTLNAVSGAKNVILHLYNSTSVAQREQVFKMSKPEIIELAVNGAKMLYDATADISGVRYEYSPESFTGTEIEYAVEVCNAVLEVFKPRADRKVIINLPSTVEYSAAHVYANQVEYVGEHLNYRDNVILSLHNHNDRGGAIADAELGLLAGAERIEGTMFGNGERTGNVDIVTLALNLYANGVEPNLKLENIMEVAALYERCTGMRIPPRQPYAGKLVFAAFSGSHQDAITKSMKWRESHNDSVWNVPYLIIDPRDIGRDYDENVIRINSQSGKGGIGFMLESKYGFTLPPKMREDFGYIVKGISDREHKEISASEILKVFYDSYVNIDTPLKLVSKRIESGKSDREVIANIVLEKSGKRYSVRGVGNGGLDAATRAISEFLKQSIDITAYTEHALGEGSHSRAVAYVGISLSGKTSFGAGIDEDIMVASISALLSAINRI